MRVAKTHFTSVTECKICEMKAAGILNPEDSVLTAYMLSADINRMPFPIDYEDGYEEGVNLLQLFPEDQMEQSGRVPMSGGVVGTVKAIFRAFGFTRTKQEIEEAEPVSRTVAKRKRGKGLYGPAD